MKTPGIVVVGAVRSPMGKFGGSFREMMVYDLAAQVIRKLMEKLDFSPERVEEVLIGSCRQAGNGPNPGRTASVRGGMPQEVPVTTFNMACPSGMKALETAAMRLLLGAARFVLVGGMESMSTMPYLLKNCRWNGFKMGNRVLYDGWVDSTDPLIDAGMGATAENLNDRYGIPREEQDAYAGSSHERAHRAWESGAFDEEVVPIAVGEQTVTRDETIRYPVRWEKLARLPAVFRKGGTVTAGNACAMSDGASFLLLTTREIAEAEGLPMVGELAAFAQYAVDPATMGEGPAFVIPRLLEENGLQLGDIDLLEVNEAFAVQILANERVLGWDRERLNVHGGAIALGHPTGCTGARIVTTLLHALRRHDKELGVASLCGAGGVTMATLVRSIR
jgi:acetyl-CoA C-acetyltransferase